MRVKTKVVSSYHDVLERRGWDVRVSLVTSSGTMEPLNYFFSDKDQANHVAKTFVDHEHLFSGLTLFKLGGVWVPPAGADKVFDHIIRLALKAE